THAPSFHSHTPTRTALSATRDSHGRIKRSEVAKRDFERHHTCPSTGKTSSACPGYVIDHVVPLKRGGADAPGNMQWQTKDAAKAKDRWEERLPVIEKIQRVPLRDTWKHESLDFTTWL